MISETLIGVIIGGVVGSIAPLATLFYNHLHWKREAKLTHLKSERVRLEQLFEKTLTRFKDAIKAKSYPSDMSAAFIVLMSKEISELYDNFMMGNDESPETARMAYLDIAVAMKKELAKVDKKINDCIS